MKTTIVRVKKLKSGFKIYVDKVLLGDFAISKTGENTVYFKIKAAK